MMIVIGILAALVFILSFLILKMQSDLKSINKQMKIKLMKDSNFRVTSDLSLDTFNTLCENLNAMYDKYRDVNIDRNQSEKRFKNMLSYIAHDIRTPLTSAQAYLQLLQDQDEHSENQQYYRIIKETII